jgi:hypothetical protein
MKFEKIFGEKIGKRFAEAHHLVPLSKLKHEIKTHLEDLITVCANCHRMLHKMNSERDDVQKLKRIVRQLAPKNKRAASSAVGATSLQPRATQNQSSVGAASSVADSAKISAPEGASESSPR